MPNFICVTCGTQYPEANVPPQHCHICEDERQYVGPDGQRWTTLEHLRANHDNVIREHEPNLVGIGSEPRFAIGQRALLVRTPEGNILWDCITLIEDTTIASIKALGGIKAIAISHPHYYSAMVEWSQAFGGVPIYLHADDREHVMRPDPAIVYWTGETHSLGDGLTLIRCGGHFDGGTVLHWRDGADGLGALLTGDIIYVAQDRRWVSFMYSYPNLIPLSPAKVQHIVDAVAPYTFDRIYSAWWDTVMRHDGQEAVHLSAERYIRAITE